MSNVLGLSHLCVGCTGTMDEVEQALVSCGYALHFAHADLPNPKPKRHLVRMWTEVHELRLFTASGLPAIEILHHHDRAVPGVYNFQPCIYIPEAGTAERDILDRSGVYVTDENISVSGNLLVNIACEDVRACVPFWEQAMGFAVQSCGENRAELRFRALSPTWCIDVCLEKSDGPVEPTFLDDLGCTCLSFLVRDISDALEDCREHGARDVGEIFSLDVGGKSVDVALVRGPRNELIELLQFG